MKKGSGEIMKPSGIGGMAVMEGVMMKNKDQYAVAVRTPSNEIVVEKSTHKDFSEKVKLFKLPIFRGILAFVDSLVLGVKVLNFSASFFEEEEEEKDTKKKTEKSKNKNVNKAIDDKSDFEIEEVSGAHNDQVEQIKLDSDKNDKSTALMMFFAVVISIVLSVALFMVLPVLLSNIFKHFTQSNLLLNLIEGIIRFGIFIGYVLLASRMNEIKRVFMYHGAEHKTINCLENGYELTVENVRHQSKEHKRCGTSFTLLVILISLVFFMFVPSGNLLWKILSRVIFVPFIAGVSYEFIRLAGKSESKWVEIVSKPGLWMQGLTTKEPDDTMIEVAIKSVDAVFDWQAFLAPAKESKKNRSSNDKKQSTAVKPQNKAKNEVKTDNKIQTDAKVENKSKSEVKLDTKVSSESKLENKDKNEKQIKSNTLNKEKSTPSYIKPSKAEEEDDEILKALDKFFDQDTQKVAEGN